MFYQELKAYMIECKVEEEHMLRVPLPENIKLVDRNKCSRGGGVGI